ncbi:hypothetical protein BCF11_0997 [Collimonas sp. PA-H2]|nr:hypothetical protein BCF11_0997 [Collimonas sp. PA-H2]
MLTFKMTTVGSSEGFILNKEAKARLNVQKGDSIKKCAQSFYFLLSWSSVSFF